MNFEKVMKGIFQAYALIHDDDYAMFMASVAMLIETYCAEHGHDVREMTERLFKASIDVNNALGTFKPNIMSVNGIPS